jgi:hypothetical protein
MNIIKTSYKDVHTIKMRVFGNTSEIKRKTRKVSEKVNAVHAGLCMYDVYFSLKCLLFATVIYGCSTAV